MSLANLSIVALQDRIDAINQQLALIDHEITRIWDNHRKDWRRLINVSSELSWQINKSYRKEILNKHLSLTPAETLAAMGDIRLLLKEYEDASEEHKALKKAINDQIVEVKLSSKHAELIAEYNEITRKIHMIQMNCETEDQLFAHD